MPQDSLKLESKEQLIVKSALSFIQQIKKFRYSTLSLNPEFLDIYKNKSLDLNQQPTVWQAVIYSVQKFAENPFDTGREVFEVLFMVLFGPYFLPRSLQDTPTFKQLKPYISSDAKYEQEKKHRQVFIKCVKQELQQTALTQSHRENLPSMRQWLKQYSTLIKETKIPKLQNEQIAALIQQVKKAKSLMALEYILNTIWYMSVISAKTTRQKINMKLRVQTMLRHDQLSQWRLTQVDVKIWYYLKRKIFADCAYFYSESEKICPKKLIYFSIYTFVSVTTDHELIDSRQYMHGIHKAAQRCKNLFLADMIKSKCFSCEAERFSSSNIFRMRIYQCLCRKFHNALSDYEKKKAKDLVIQQFPEEDVEGRDEKDFEQLINEG